MRKLGLSAVVLGLLAAGVGGHSADAAERRCEFRFDHEKPAWVAELRPKVRQRLAGLLGQIMVLELADQDRSYRKAFNCGCFMDHVDWDAVRSNFPAWYRTEPVASGKLATEYAAVRDRLRQTKTAFRQKYCL